MTASQQIVIEKLFELIIWIILRVKLRPDLTSVPQLWSKSEKQSLGWNRKKKKRERDLFICQAKEATEG